MNYVKEDATEIALCEDWKKMCFILWKEDIEHGNILVKVLRRGCWNYENNERESCNTTNCLKSRHSVGEMHFCCCQADLCNIQFTKQRVFQTSEHNHSVQTAGNFLGGGTGRIFMALNFKLDALIYAAYVFFCFSETSKWVNSGF